MRRKGAFRRTLAGLAALLAVSGCASGGAGGGSGVTKILRLAGSTEPSPPHDGSEYFVVDTVRGTADRAFNAVRFTYEALGIAFTYYDADNRELGSFVERLGDIDGQPPSAWLDCGHGPVAGNNADQYFTSLALGTRVLPVDSLTSTVETVIRGRAQQREVLAPMTRCSTRGTLEARIAEGARDLLKKYGAGGGR